MKILSGAVVVGFGLFLVGLAAWIIIMPSRAEKFLRGFASSALTQSRGRSHHLKDERRRRGAVGAQDGTKRRAAPISLAPLVALRVVRSIHTLVWAFFASAVLAVPVAAWQRRFELMMWLSGIVLVEVVVLALNRLRCPLTAVAARYTANRDPNFDIYLPMWLARYNKEIFGSIFAAGLVIGFVRWLT